MNEPKPRENETSPTTVLEDVTDRLTASLTVLSARTQLLQRSIHRGQVGEASDCLRDLAAITQATQELEQEVRRLHAIIRTRRRAQASNRGVGSHDTWTG
jgi:CRISPR/Cas system-associated endoribonuclease Cas2